MKNEKIGEMSKTNQGISAKVEKGSTALAFFIFKNKRFESGKLSGFRKHVKIVEDCRQKWKRLNIANFIENPRVKMKMLKILEETCVHRNTVAAMCAGIVGQNIRGFVDVFECPRRKKGR